MQGPSLRANELDVALRCASSFYIIMITLWYLERFAYQTCSMWYRFYSDLMT